MSDTPESPAAPLESGETVVARPIDRADLKEGVAGALALSEQAKSLANRLANRAQRLVFVGCGAPHQLLSMLQYWLSRTDSGLQLHRYYPAELIAQDPPRLDEHTLVVLGSQSGTTRETVEAAEYLRNKPCTTLAVTQRDESPLAQAANEVLSYGATQHGYYAAYITAQTFLSYLLQARDEGPLTDPVLAALPALPDALADAMVAVEDQAKQLAAELQEDRVLYVTGAGPMYATAYVFAVCFLMEMQWMAATPLQAAELFHGPFEALDAHTPLIALVGEDPSRPIAERVVRFGERHLERMSVFDSKDLPTSGIDPAARPVLSPLLVDAALTRLVEHLASVRQRPLTTRRYMGKVEY
ncbi:MAG: SIS domain-containing protein [Chloroflexi bacterium]|nr:SIS domain-containing protein [Chloroflexota bacterium]